MKKNIILLLFTSISFGQAEDKLPNIILMIGDGMGLSHITAGMYANNNKTILEEFEYIGLSKTHSLNYLITDSAASGTAMASGVKTLNRVVGIDENNKKTKSILEICKEKKYNVGLVVTSEIVHATPASFYAKVQSRYNYEDIALQLSEHDVDLFVGGGKDYFNKRKDKRNLLEEMSDYTFVDSFDEFKNSSSKKIGFFIYPGKPPSKALEFAITDRNTLIIVTSDHETGGLYLSGGNVKKSRVKADFSTGGHSGSMVPVFSYGPNSELFSGIYDNTSIFDKMLKTIEN